MSKVLKNILKSRGIEVKKPIIEDEMANQVIFGCKRKDGGPVLTKTDLEFKKLSLRSVIVPKFRKMLFKVLTTISCQLKALARFT